MPKGAKVCQSDAPVGLVDVVRAEAEDEEHDCDLQARRCRALKLARLLDADDEDRRDDERDDECGQVEAELVAEEDGRVRGAACACAARSAEGCAISAASASLKALGSGDEFGVGGVERSGGRRCRRPS